MTAYLRGKLEIRTGLFATQPSNIEVMWRNKRGLKWALLIQFPRISLTTRKAFDKTSS